MSVPPQEDFSPIRCFATVLSNEEIIPRHNVIRCHAPELAVRARPGHFVNALTADGYDCVLRKPFSIFTADPRVGEISILYAIGGPTTRGMSRRREGETIDLVGPLGRRLFDPDTRPGATHVMVGGGYGVPPLVFLSQRLQLEDPSATIIFIIGAREQALLLCEEHIAACGIDTRVSTEDGSRGTTGRVTDVLRPVLSERGDTPVTVYCCGPTPMMRAVGDVCGEYRTPCQVSVEVGMPCGIGVCMACVVDLTDGRRVRSCTDGPVFEAAEVRW